MTKEQFEQAYKIRNELNSNKNKLIELERMIDRLKELGAYGAASEIQIKLNDQWVATPIGIVDYSDLLSFLIGQRDKLSNKMNNLKKEFTELWETQIDLITFMIL